MQEGVQEGEREVQEEEAQAAIVSTRASVLLAFALGLLFLLPSAATANPITDENARPGTPGWELEHANRLRLDGYGSKTSVAQGESITFHVSTNPAANYRINIYRLGWYGGAGARLMQCLPNCSGSLAGSAQSYPDPNSETGLIEAGWPQSASLTIPSGWTTGEYVAQFELMEGPQEGLARYHPFVVRPATPADILVMVPHMTYLAYNVWGEDPVDGGTGAYENFTDADSPFPPTDHSHAYKVSFNRPDFQRREWRRYDLPLLRFLEREGYDVSYVSETDVDANPGILLQHKAVIVSGHSEYWTTTMRNGFESARDQGVDLVFMGANDAYWHVRFEDSSCPPDATVCNTVGDRRTMVIYKEEEAGDDQDPVSDPQRQTILFRDLPTPRPECELMGGVMYGSEFENDGYADYTTTAAGAADPWSAGSGLTEGSMLVGLMGFEFDHFWPDCDVPGTPKILFTYDDPMTPEHDAAAVRYTAPSGARVFSSGSLQFPWGLDDYRWSNTLFPPGAIPTNPGVQQFTRNMLADMAPPDPPGSPQSPVTSPVKKCKKGSKKVKGKCKCKKGFKKVKGKGKCRKKKRGRG
jgi:hypothetical protein